MFALSVGLLRVCLCCWAFYLFPLGLFLGRLYVVVGLICLLVLLFRVRYYCCFVIVWVLLACSLCLCLVLLKLVCVYCCLIVLFDVKV